MKAKELIYNLRANLEEVGSQLATKTDQHLMYMLDSARTVLSAQKMDRAVNVSQLVQYVDVTPTQAPKADLGLTGEANIMKLTIPKPAMYNNGEAIFTVGAIDGEDSFSKITFSQLRTALYRKYTGSAPKWLWHNDAIYIINIEIDSLAKVRVRAIFEEPYQVEIAMGRYKYLTPFDWEYPLTFKDAKAVYQLAMSAELGWGDIAVQSIQNAQRRQQRDTKEQDNAQV